MYLDYPLANISEPIKTPQDISRPFVSFFEKQTEGIENDKEHFVCIGLNARHIPQYFQIVSIGTLDSAIVHPREVFRPAVHKGAAVIIVAHNHPSGADTPSREDIALTSRLSEAGKLIGIQLLDHLIYSGSEHLASLRRDRPEIFTN